MFMIRHSCQGLSKSVIHPIKWGLSTSTLRIWYVSLFAKPRGRYQPFRANSEISHKVGKFPTKSDCSGWTFIPWRSDSFGPTLLPQSRYSRVSWMLIRTWFLSHPLDAVLWGTPRCDPPPKEGGGVSQFGEGCEILQ